MGARLSVRLRPDFTRALLYGAAALLLGSLVRVYGGVRLSAVPTAGATVLGSLAFLGLAVLAVRSATGEVAAVSRAQFGDAHASVVGLLVALTGYAATVLGVLVILRVPLARLLVSGAVTGVVLGVAAQQSLGNVVAGLVLTLNRPFQVGDVITVRSGALAGPYTGCVRGMGLTYVRIDTAEGVVLLPNSGVLAAAVGPGPAGAQPGRPEPARPQGT